MYKANIEQFAVELDGRILSRYDSDLIKVEDTAERRQIILDLHIKREELFDRTAETSVDDRQALAEARNELEVLECQLQIAWGFTVDKTWHSWWYRLPHCGCDNWVNSQLRGKSKRVYHPACPVHGVNAVW